VGDELPQGPQLVLGRRVGAPGPAHVPGEPAVRDQAAEDGAESRTGQEALDGQRAVRLREEASVQQAGGGDPRRRPVLPLAGQELLGDGVAEVVGEDAAGADTFTSQEVGDEVGLGRDRVVEVPRLVGEAEADQVEGQDAIPLGQ
jgi:hypothetical protein